MAEQSRFTESAARLEGVVRALKTRQIEEHQGSVQFTPWSLAAESPDELWAKQFATQCIGPVCFKVAPGNDMTLPTLAQSVQSFSPTQTTVVPRQATAKPMVAVSTAARPQPIGAAIGKPTRRGLLARMFRRS
ncbi:MAG: hypothetical protein ACTHLR_07945 [Rhizomicrobium sp.]